MFAVGLQVAQDIPRHTGEVVNHQPHARHHYLA